MSNIQKIPFKTARFITSALTKEEWPSLKTPQGHPMPEIALVGRSNVGKSSLINALTGHKKLAKISATPGKTQRINFFLIDEALLLVDLPGYGYAKAPPQAAESWTKAIDTYFTSRPSLRLVLLLIDARRSPSKEDLQVIQWAGKQSFSLLVVLTKIDKLSPFELQSAIERMNHFSTDCFPFSIHDKKLLRKLQNRIHA